MWKIVANPIYVADPQGSIHNRGGAVDITLVDAAGIELDMGTPFDYVSKQVTIT
jgi:D-alanyl-D-alanine dipeptidase